MECFLTKNFVHFYHKKIQILKNLLFDQYDYLINDDKMVGRRKWYDEYLDKWFERDGHTYAFRGWHAFDKTARKNTLKDVKDSRIIMNHITKWKDNSDMQKWWTLDGRTGPQPTWPFFQSTEHEESMMKFHQHYQKYALPENFDTLKLVNQAYYYSWLTNTLIANNARFENPERRDDLHNLVQGYLSNALNNMQKRTDYRLYYELKDDAGEKVDIKKPIVPDRAAFVATTLKNVVQALRNATGKESLSENTKAENNVFWYRGVGFQNKTIWEQPHGWQLHCKPTAMLKSKNGVRELEIDSGLENSDKVPRYVWLEKKERNESLEDTPDCVNKLVAGVELKGTHPHHHRLDWTKYENLFNNAGEHIKAGDLFPNYQEALLGTCF